MIVPVCAVNSAQITEATRQSQIDAMMRSHKHITNGRRPTSAPSADQASGGMQAVDEVGALTEALRGDSESGDLYMSRSAALCSRGSFQDALRDANEAVCLDPTSYRAQECRANALAGIARHSAAASAFRRAIELTRDGAARAKLERLCTEQLDLVQTQTDAAQVPTQADDAATEDDIDSGAASHPAVAVPDAAATQAFGEAPDSDTDEDDATDGAAIAAGGALEAPVAAPAAKSVSFAVPSTSSAEVAEEIARDEYAAPPVSAYAGAETQAFGIDGDDTDDDTDDDEDAKLRGQGGGEGKEDDTFAATQAYGVAGGPGNSDDEEDDDEDAMLRDEPAGGGDGGAGANVAVTTQAFGDDPASSGTEADDEDENIAVASHEAAAPGMASGVGPAAGAAAAMPQTPSPAVGAAASVPAAAQATGAAEESSDSDATDAEDDVLAAALAADAAKGTPAGVQAAGVAQVVVPSAMDPLPVTATPPSRAVGAVGADDESEGETDADEEAVPHAVGGRSAEAVRRMADASETVLDAAGETLVDGAAETALGDDGDDATDVDEPIGAMPSADVAGAEAAGATADEAAGVADPHATQAVWAGETERFDGGVVDGGATQAVHVHEGTGRQEEEEMGGECDGAVAAEGPDAGAAEAAANVVVPTAAENVEVTVAASDAAPTPPAVSQAGSTDASTMKMDDLRHALSARGLSTLGKKAELVERLQEAMEKPAREPVDEAEKEIAAAEDAPSKATAVEASAETAVQPPSTAKRDNPRGGKAAKVAEGGSEPAPRSTRHTASPAKPAAEAAPSKAAAADAAGGKRKRGAAVPDVDSTEAAPSKSPGDAAGGKRTRGAVEADVNAAEAAPSKAAADAPGGKRTRGAVEADGSLPKPGASSHDSAMPPAGGRRGRSAGGAVPEVEVAEPPAVAPPPPKADGGGASGTRRGRTATAVPDEAGEKLAVAGGSGGGKRRLSEAAAGTDMATSSSATPAATTTSADRSKGKGKEPSKASAGNDRSRGAAKDEGNERGSRRDKEASQSQGSLEAAADGSSQGLTDGSAGRGRDLSKDVVVVFSGFDDQEVKVFENIVRRLKGKVGPWGVRHV